MLDTRAGLPPLRHAHRTALFPEPAAGGGTLNWACTLTQPGASPTLLHAGLPLVVGVLSPQHLPIQAPPPPTTYPQILLGGMAYRRATRRLTLTTHTSVRQDNLPPNERGLNTYCATHCWRTLPPPRGRKGDAGSLPVRNGAEDARCSALHT